MTHLIFKSARASRVFYTAAAMLIVALTVQAADKKPSVELVTFRKNLGELQALVAETTATLEQLKTTAKEGGSLQPIHKTFAARLAKLESSVEKIRTDGTQMRTRSEDYYKAWQDELSKMGNPKLRDKAQNRFADAKEEFDEIIVIAGEAKRELEPFMADLKDVDTYLKADLSADGVKSLNNTIWKLGNKSRAVIGSLQQVSGQISKALAELPEGK
jgi:Protein of unknown function (DUF2959)